MNDHKLITNRSRIQQLLDKARDRCESIFHHRWAEYKTLAGGNTTWLDDATHGAELASIYGKIPTRLQTQIKAGILNSWDITLIFDVFSKVTIQISRSFPSAIINNAFDVQIKTGKDLRNALNHQSRLSRLTDNDFAFFLTEFENWFLSTGSNQFEWDKIQEEIMSYGQSQIETDIKFAELGDKAEDFINQEKYKEAHDIYTEMLQLDHLSPEKKSATYVKRSENCLNLKEKKYFTQAKTDANYAIGLRPSWWRGYFALGKALAQLDTLSDAEEALINAQSLDDSSEELSNLLYAIRRKIGIFSRYDHFHPDFQPLTQTPEKFTAALLKENNLPIDPHALFNFMMDTQPLADVIRGDQFRDGNGVKQDFTEAAKYYAIAAEKNVPSGMLRLGNLYEEGKGVNIDYKKMLYWYEKAANSDNTEDDGVAEAQHCLGILYFDGVGEPKNYTTSAKWFEKASSNSYGPATNNLGLMYLKGHGVEKSLNKAVALFKKAAEQGDTGAMINLSSCCFSANGISPFLTADDIAEGKRWLKRAAEKGNILAQKQLDDFESVHPVFQMIQPFANLIKPPSTRINPFDEQFREAIEKAAQKGSVTAQQHIKIWENTRLALDAFAKGNLWEAYGFMSLVIRVNYQIAKMPDVMKLTIKEMAKKYPDNEHVITCFVHLDNKVIIEHFDKFNNIEHFQLMKLSFLIMSNKNREAADFANICTKQYPNNLWFLYLFAIVTRDITLFDDFLNSAPTDHNKIPEIHYRKAAIFLKIENIPAFIESFEAGLESEKNQLPCFLPYEYQTKELLNKQYLLKKNPGELPKLRQQGNEMNSQMKKLFQTAENEVDARKQKILTHHRKCFTKTYPTFLKKTSESHALPLRRKYSNLKEISLKDIYEKQGHAFLGHILEARIIDWAVGYPNTFIVIEDENGDTARVLICKCKLPNHAQLMKHFCPNSIISINGPLMEQDDDGQIYILVESPAHIHLDNTDTQKNCYICNKEGHMLKCTGCQMALYCSQDCQKLDWEKFGHKSVCRYLKNLPQTYKSLRN